MIPTDLVFPTASSPAILSLVDKLLACDDGKRRVAKIKSVSGAASVLGGRRVCG